MIQPPVGTHCLLELRGCPMQLLDDVAYIRTALTDAALASGATLLNIMSHQFEPQGVTAIALLSESHVSIHTWPEMGYAAVDLFTCGDTCQPGVGCELLIERFEALDHTLETVRRGGSGVMQFLPAPSVRQERTPVRSMSKAKSNGKAKATATAKANADRKAMPCPVPN